ncbi:MAG: helix-turn-helix domain-containing protein, partial [Thermoleophilia bacterium]|nr:helix-turn-helix domain-containing protein [Thermoleophilia bacterium]
MAGAREYLSADEAAAYLGVSRPTLYAYVSRGQIPSEPDPSAQSRARRYPRAALDELRSRRERRRNPELRAHGALRHGPPVFDSALTLIASGRLWYRGRDACVLSRSATFEQVASLLWTGSAEQASDLFGRPGRAGAGDGRGSLVDRLVAALVAARRDAPVTLAEPAPPALRAAGRLVARLFGAAGATGPGTLAERLARGWRAPSAADLNAALVLCADHELNASAFTARCVASTDAPVANAVLAALCALEGRRHGGASERVEELLRAAERDGPRRAWERALSTDGWIPGLDHRLYPGGDPRAAELLTRLELPPGDPPAQLLARAREELGVHPSLEFALGVLARQARLPQGASFALFALGRSAGWI